MRKPRQLLKQPRWTEQESERRTNRSDLPKKKKIVFEKSRPAKLKKLNGNVKSCADRGRPKKTSDEKLRMLVCRPNETERIEKLLEHLASMSHHPAEVVAEVAALVAVVLAALVVIATKAVAATMEDATMLARRALATLVGGIKRFSSLA